MKIGIVICSRADSRRVPSKPFVTVQNKYLLEHLLDRVIGTGLHTYLAVPHYQYERYWKLLTNHFQNNQGYSICCGSREDPLLRTLQTAKSYNLDHVIRITHDKVFISKEQIAYFIEVYKSKKLDYLFSTNFIDGMSFEIFSTKLLEKCHKQFKDVEHLSFALDACSDNKLNLQDFPLCRTSETKQLRLLIDYPNDVKMIDKILSKYGMNTTAQDIIKIYKQFSKFFNTNKLPLISVYTCAYNAEKYLSECYDSIFEQKFTEYEHLLVDDCSKDKTLITVGKYNGEEGYRFVLNSKNVGLASSSNIALKNIVGKYVIRLDADDYFIGDNVLGEMLEYMETHKLDILYPDNMKEGKIQHGNEQHHVGGSMFRRRALDYLKFTDGLRHFEGQDLYRRAVKNKLKIGYFKKPTFFYRQHDKSLSKSKSLERKNVLESLNQGKVGVSLLR